MNADKFQYIVHGGVMTALFSIIAFLAGIAVCWFLITSYIGRNAPNSVKGRAYLKNQLTRSGYDLSRVPDACLDEIVAIAEKSARFMTSSDQKNFLFTFTKNLDDMVTIFWQWLRDPSDPLFQYKGPKADKNAYRDIFERHGI
jgi:hypothetical protein